MPKQKPPFVLAATFLVGLLSLALSVGLGLAQSPSAPVDSQAAAPDTLFDCTWSNAAVLPAPVLDTATVTLNGILYVFGGINSGASSTTSYKFDGTTWTPITSLPQALEFAAAVTDGTSIYVVGGALPGGVPQASLFRYDVAANSYTPL